MRKPLKYAFRITHIDNIQNITTYGIVRKDSTLKYKDFTKIGDPQIIHLREDIEIKGHRIGSYIPFYLGPRSPMLYVIQHGYNGVQQVDPEKIVYCVVRLKDILNSDIDCIFTDGHVLSRLSNIYPKDELKHISDIINYDDVYSIQWNSELDLDLKRRKEAELLFIDDLPIELVCGFVVYNDIAKQMLMNLGTEEKKIIVRPNYYF